MHNRARTTFVPCPIRAAIERWGAGTKTLRADADLLGATADTAHLDLFMPTPIDK